MRSLFLLLVLANVAFFAWWRYGSPPDSGLDPQPLARQIEPEKLKIIPNAELAKLPARKGAVAPAPPAPAAPPAAAAVAAQPPVTAGGQPIACLEWGSFTLADAPRMEKALEPLGLGERLGQRRTEETAGWWVFIPALKVPNQRQAALREAAELRNLGIEDYFIVQEEGQHRWALSLGVFRTEEAARARLAVLRDQGVRTAVVGARETVVPKVWLQVKGVDPALEAKIKELTVQVESTELRACP
jgi:hypothetical protein